MLESVDGKSAMTDGLVVHRSLLLSSLLVL